MIVKFSFSRLVSSDRSLLFKAFSTLYFSFMSVFSCFFGLMFYSFSISDDDFKQHFDDLYESFRLFNDTLDSFNRRYYHEVKNGKNN